MKELSWVLLGFRKWLLTPLYLTCGVDVGVPFRQLWRMPQTSKKVLSLWEKKLEMFSVLLLCLLLLLMLGYVEQDCSSEVSCCDDTCSRVSSVTFLFWYILYFYYQVLTCGEHKCVRMCHFGDCGPCLQMTMKSCKCGQKKKSVLCPQEFLCESKCQRMRQCGRHLCRRKVNPVD